MKDLALLCPSRERPELCLALVNSTLETTSADILIYLDSDDPRLLDYHLPENDRVHVLVEPCVGRGEAVEKLIHRFPPYRMYMVLSDDAVFVRTGWDQEVIAAMDAFGDDIGLVHLESENHQPYVNWACVSRKWIDTLGYYNYPGCTFFCQDTILQILAEALGRITYIQPQVVNHLVHNHPDWSARLAKDTNAFLWYCATQFGKDLAKLRGVMA